MRKFLPLILVLVGILLSSCVLFVKDRISQPLVEYPKDHMRIVLLTIAENLESIEKNIRISRTLAVDFPGEIVETSRKRFAEFGIKIESMHHREKKDSQETGIKIVRRSEFEEDEGEAYYECIFSHLGHKSEGADAWSFAVRVWDAVGGDCVAKFQGIHAHYE